MLHQSMVDLYPSENLNAWNLLSVRHFVYKLLFHVHLPRFEDILIWIDCRFYYDFSSKIVIKVFHIWIDSAHRESLHRCHGGQERILNTKSTVKVETGIVTLISYHHYLKIVGNNKLWPDVQKESWNIHLTKILIWSHTLNGTDS